MLCFGLLRPYKGLDVLLEAWREIEGAELWIAGMPRMDLARAARGRAAGGALAATLPQRRRDARAHAQGRACVVLPYREIDQSGVAFAALGAGLPLLLSDVGGFPELAATGAARTFPDGDAPALADALRELLADPDSLASMARRAREAAAGALLLGCDRAAHARGVRERHRGAGLTGPTFSRSRSPGRSHRHPRDGGRRRAGQGHPAPPRRRA